MSVELIVERPSGTISLDEWKRAVADHADLRIRQTPYFARNPTTGDIIEMPAGVADCELNWQGQWIPLLRYTRGKLRAAYSADFADPNNLERVKIAQLARELGAVIVTDIADETLDW